jgi:hypothetical protein
MSFTVSAVNEKSYASSARGSAWWDRWRDKGPPNRVQPRTDLVEYGSENVLSTFDGYRYFWDAQRINPPGFADQDWFTMSRSYYSQIYLGISTMNRHVYQAEAEFYTKDAKEPDRKNPVDPSDDVVEFFDHPNPHESLADINEQCSLQLHLTGQGPIWTPWELEYDWDRPQEMYVLSTASLIPQPLSPQWPNGAWLVQPWLPAGPYAQVPVQMGIGTVVPAEQMHLVKFPHPFFRWVGYSLLFALQQITDTVKMIDVSRSNAMKQGINPPFMITFENMAFQPDPAQLRRLQAMLQQIYAGPKNAGLPFIAPPFAKLTRTTNTPDEMMYEAGWEQLLTFTLACMGLNRSICNLGDSNFAKTHAEIMGFYANSLDPLLARISSVMSREIIHPFYGRDIHLHMHGRTMADKQQDIAVFNAGSRAGVMKIGEGRKLLGLKPSERDDEWMNAPGQQPGGMGGGTPGQGMPGAPGSETATDPGNVFSSALGELDTENARPEVPTGSKSWLLDREESLQTTLEQLRRKGRAKDVLPNGRKSAAVPDGPFWKKNGNGKNKSH